MTEYVSRPVLGPTQPALQWVQGALSLRVKQPGSEVDKLHLHSPIRLHGVVLS
jgi:hypothetical protein